MHVFFKIFCSSVDLNLSWLKKLSYRALFLLVTHSVHTLDFLTVLISHVLTNTALAVITLPVSAPEHLFVVVYFQIVLLLISFFKDGWSNGGIGSQPQYNSTGSLVFTDPYIVGK